MENRQNVYSLTDVNKTVKHRASSQVKFIRHENCYNDTEVTRPISTPYHSWIMKKIN